MEGGEAAVLTGELLREDAVVAIAALLVGARGAEDVRPGGPGRLGGAAVGGAGEELPLLHAEGAVAVHGAETVGAGIAAAEDDDALAGGGDDLALRDVVAGYELVLRGQEVHREVDAVELAAGDGEVAGVGGATGETDGVELVHQVAGVDVDADVDAGAEDDALRLHLLEAAVDEAFLHLELGDAVAEKAADAVVAFEDGDVVAGAAELLGGGEAGGPGADDGDAALGALLRRFGVDPALAPGALDDADLDLLDGDGVIVDAEDAGGLAGGGAEPAGELGEVVRGVEAVDGVAPVAAVHEVVPVGNDVAEGTALVAEGHTAVHAAGGLLVELLGRHLLVVLEPVGDALGHGAAGRPLAVELDEARDLSHRLPPPARARPLRGPSAR